MQEPFVDEFAKVTEDVLKSITKDQVINGMFNVIWMIIWDAKRDLPWTKDLCPARDGPLVLWTARYAFEPTNATVFKGRTRQKVKIVEEQVLPFLEGPGKPSVEGGVEGGGGEIKQEEDSAMKRSLPTTLLQQLKAHYKVPETETLTSFLQGTTDTKAKEAICADILSSCSLLLRFHSLSNTLGHENIGEVPATPPDVILGDFNTKITAADTVEVEGTPGWVYAPCNPSTPTNRSSNAPYIYDNIYVNVSRGLRHRFSPDKDTVPREPVMTGTLIDHIPLFATLQWD